MAKLETLSLPELYARKMTSSVEKVIMLKEDFSKNAPNWCEKVCKLNCKAPPRDSALVPTDYVDILIIQDHKAFGDGKYGKKPEQIEKTHLEIIIQIAGKAFKAKGEQPKLSYKVTSLLKCQLTKEDIKKNKAPTDTVLMKCKPYVLKEIELRKPKVIISLNTAVTKAMGLKKTNYGNRGEIFGNVVFTLHPRTLLMLRQNSSGKFWGPDFYKIIERDFMKAAALARGELRNPNLLEAVEGVRKQIHVARNMADVEAFCEELIEAGREGMVLSYDTETNGLDPYATGAKLLTAQFGYRHKDGYIKALVFPLWHRENKFYDPDKAWSFIAEILLDEQIGKIGHNIKFDCLFTYCTAGVRIRGIRFDTMLLLHSLDSGTQGNLGLKQAVWDYLPSMELGGYEDLLPKCVKISKVKDEETLDEENTED